VSPDGKDLHIGEIEIRPGEYQVLIDGRRVGLTVREFEIFYCLARRPDRVLTRAEIYDAVWRGPMAYRDRSVDVFIRKVRRKLAQTAPSRSYIHTHFGIGYRFSPEPAPGQADEPGPAHVAEPVWSDEAPVAQSP